MIMWFTEMFVSGNQNGGAMFVLSQPLLNTVQARFQAYLIKSKLYEHLQSEGFPFHLLFWQTPYEGQLTAVNRRQKEPYITALFISTWRWVILPLHNQHICDRLLQNVSQGL